MNPDFSVSGKDRQAIRKRAGGRCEYCHLKDIIIAAGSPFNVEHIRSPKKFPPGDPSADDPSNLAWSCPRCNNAKRMKVSFQDPKTGQIVRLFNPRTDKWRDHFIAIKRTGRIEGKTAIGRATVEALKFNEPPEERVQSRQYLSKWKQWP
jgi:5-methylcytosine-specific restriction endonuclease McrA